MKLLQLFEKSSNNSSGPAVLSKVIAYISKQLGVEFTRIPGVEHFKNSAGNGYGIRFVQNGTTKMIRFNWSSESAISKLINMQTIDIFTGKTRDPNFTIKTHGISILQALPVIISVLEEPKAGKVTAFPVDPSMATVSEAVDPNVQRLASIWNSLKIKAEDNGAEITSHEEGLIKSDIMDKLKKGWTNSEIIKLLANMEEINPNVNELTALNRMSRITKEVEARLKGVKESSKLDEAHRDDYTSESALNDFLHQLAQGNSFTRSEFIGRYHPIHVGIFDTIMNEFSDRFIIQNRRISLASNVNLDRIKDSILSKAGVVEVTKGGTQEVYFKTPAEEKIEKEERVPYADTLEHLEGLVKALIKGSFNALFVAGKGGTGKTQTVERTLHDAGLTDGSGYFKNTGSASAAGLYTVLYHHRQDIILFDDSDGIFKDLDARNILKAATDTKKTRKLVWNKKSSFIYDPDDANAEDYQDDLSMAPRYFDFKGRIIFVSNLTIDQLDPDGALRTRAFLINVDPTDEELFDHMGKILMDIRLEDGLELSQEEREHVLKIVKTGKRKGAASLRSLVRALNLAASGAPNWEKLVELYA